MKIKQNIDKKLLISTDGKDIGYLLKDEKIKLSTSKHPMFAISSKNPLLNWTCAINKLLKWNQNFKRNKE